MVAPSKKAKRNQKKRQNRKKKQQQQRAEEEEEERLRISQSISTSTSTSSGNSSTADGDGVNDEDADNGKNTTNENVNEGDNSATITTTIAAQIENSEVEKEKEIPPPLLVAGSRNDSDVNLLDHIPEDSRCISTPTRSPLSSTNSSIKEEEEEEIQQEQEQAEAEVESSSSSSPSPSSQSQSLPPLTLPETTNSEETGPPPPTTTSSSEETVPTSNKEEQTTTTTTNNNNNNNNNVESPPSPSPILTPLFATDTTTTATTTTSAVSTAETPPTTTPISPSSNNFISTTSTICSSQNEQDQNVTSDVDDDDDIEDLVEEISRSSNNNSNTDNKIPTTAEQNATATTVVPATTTTGGLGIMRTGGGGTTTTTGIATTAGVAGGINLRLGLGMMTMGGSGSGGEGITADITAEEGGSDEGTTQELKLPQEPADVQHAAASLLSSVAITTTGEPLSTGTIQTKEEVQDENEFVNIDQITVDERNVDGEKDKNKNMDNNINTDSIAHQKPMELNTSPTPTPKTIYDDDNNEESMGSSSTSRTNNPEIIMKNESIANFPPVNYDVTKSKSLSMDILLSDENNNIISSPPLPSTNTVEPTSNDTKKEEEEGKEEVTPSTAENNDNDDSMKKEKDNKKSSWSESQAVSESLPQQTTTNDVDSTSIEQKEEEESDKQKQQLEEQSPSDNIAVPTETFDEGTMTASTQIQSETDILADENENDDSNEKKTVDSDSSSKIHKQCDDVSDNGNNNSPNATKKNEEASETGEIPSKQRQQQLNKEKMSPWASMKLLMTDMESLLAGISDKEDESKTDLVVEERIQDEEGDKGESSNHTSKNNENDVTGITSTSSSSSVLTEDEIKVTAMVDTVESSDNIIASEEVVVVEEEARGTDNQTTTMTMDSDGQTEAINTVVESIEVQSNEIDDHRELETRKHSSDRIPVPQCKDDLKTPANADSDVLVTSEAANGETDKETPESCTGSSSPVVDNEPDENDEDPAPEMWNEKSNQETSNNVQVTTSPQTSHENINRETSNIIEEIASSEPKEDPNHLMPAPQKSDDDAIENKDNGLLAVNKQSAEEIGQQTPIASSLTVIELDKYYENSNAHDGKGTTPGPETSGNDSISPDVDFSTTAEIRKSVTLDHDRTIVADSECGYSRNQATSESSSVDVQQNGNGIETDDQQRPRGIDQPTTLETKEEDLDIPIHLTRKNDEDTTCNKEKEATIKPIAALSVSDSASTVAEKPEFDKTTASSAADDEIKDALLVDLKDALASFRQKKADIEALVSDCEKDPKIQNEPDSNDVKDSSNGKVSVDTGDSSVVQGISTTGNIEAADPQSRGNGASVSGENLFGDSDHSHRNEASMKGEEKLVDSLEIIRDSDRSSIKKQVMDSPSPVQQTNHQAIAMPPTNSAGPTKNETSKESSIGEKQEVASHSSEGSKLSETPTDCVPNDCTPTSPTRRKRSAIISSVSTRIDCLQATAQAAETKESIQGGPKNDSLALSKVNNVSASAKRDELAASLLENHLPSSVDSGSIRTVTIEFFDETETSTIGDRTLSEQNLSRVSHSPANEDINKREDLPSNKGNDLALSMHSLPNGGPIEKYSPKTPKVGISTRLPPLPLSAPPKIRSRFAFSKPKKVNRLAQIIRTELWSEDIKIVEAALLELEKLAEKDSATIARTGGILAIVQVMEHHIDQPEIQVAACQALEKLALDHENEVAISEVGGLEAVISSMMANFEDDTVHEAAWSALWNLTCHHADLSIDIEDGLQALTSCMTQHSQQPSVQRNACGTLANLCQSPDRLKALRNAGGFVAIATALEAHWDDEQVRQEASNALTTLLEPHTDTYELHLEEESPSMYKFTPSKSKVPSDPPDAPDP